MNRMLAHSGTGFTAAVRKPWNYRLIQDRDSACCRRVYTFALILTILVALATALIAPSINMPEGVLREHHVSLHAAAVHGINHLLCAGPSAPINLYDESGLAGLAEFKPLTSCEHLQSPVVMRC
jgi:hypothetical protein